ncbi:MAG: hypothetical protein AB7D46_00740 [Flavobacteriaceae bacterium]
MTTELKNRLDEVVGKEFNYKGKDVTITKYKDVGGTNVVVFMDDRPTNLLLHEVDTFLTELYSPLGKTTTPAQIVVPKNELLVFEPTKENGEVKETLLEILRKVKEDKAYIPQAQAVCGVVNQLVNVQKTEIQMLNILNKRK